MTPASDARATGPYVGLQPFRATDRAYFKGRESDQRVVIANLRTAPLTILYGAAGVGKSSLLLAGVVPQLHEMLPRTPVIVFRDWVGADFQRRLARACIDATWRLGSDHPQPADDRPLDEVLRACAEAAHSVVLVLLDQFEEYLLYHPKSDAADSFEAHFARAVNREEVDVGFLISVREASLPKLDRFRERIPQLLGNSLRLKHLDERAAREAIGQTVLDEWNTRHPGEPPMHIEDELVTQVILDAQADPTRGLHGGQGVARAEPVIEAPFLQLVMSRLWQEETRQGSRLLRLATLQQRLGGAKNIVRSHLEEVMSGLDDRHRDVCASFFERLVTPSGGKVACNSDDLLKWAGTALAPDVPDTLDLLSARRILRTVAAEPETPEQTRYEIFHEVLAPAILDWQRGYVEAKERQQAVERTRLRARQRWLPWLAAATLAALVGLGFSVIYNIESGANRRAAESMAVAPYDAERALELAIDAADRTRWPLDPTPATEDALRLAVQATRLERTLRLDDKVMGVAVSPDGSKAVTREVDDRPASRASGLIVWDITSRTPTKLAERRLPDPYLLGRVAFLPAGDTVVAVIGSSAWLWKFSDPAAAPVELPHGMPISTALAVSADGQRIATAGSQLTGDVRTGSIKVWRLGPAGPGLEHTFDADGAWLMGLAFSPGGCCLATAAVSHGSAQPSYAAVWSVSSGKRLLDLPMAGPSDAIAFAPDGQSLVLAGRDSLVRVLRPASSTLDRILSEREQGPSTAGNDVLWNERPLAGHLERVRDVVFSADSSRIASASGDRTVMVWDARTGENLFTLAGHRNYVEAAAFSRQGQQLVSVGRDRTLRLWNIASHTAGVYAIDFNPDARRQQFATASGDRSAKLWGRSGDLPHVEHTLSGHTDTVYRLAYAPGGQQVATASFDHTARLWDAASGQLLRTFTGHLDQLRDLAFSADGAYLATSAADGKARLYALADAAAPAVEVAHNDKSVVTVSALAMDPKRPRWVTGGWDGVLRLWDWQGRPQGSIPASPAYTGDAPRIVRLLFTRQGRELAALIGRAVYFWPVSRFERNEGPPPLKLVVERVRHCEWMALSPDETQLAVGCNDGAVRLYDIRGAAPLLIKTVRVHRNWIQGVAFSADGKTLGSASLDNNFQISPLEFQALHDLAVQREAVITDRRD